MNAWFTKNKERLFFAICGVSALYIAIHFVIEKEELAKITSVRQFILEGKNHFFHLLPITIALVVFIAVDIRQRIRAKRQLAVGARNEDIKS